MQSRQNDGRQNNLACPQVFAHELRLQPRAVGFAKFLDGDTGLLAVEFLNCHERTIEAENIDGCLSISRRLG